MNCITRKILIFTLLVCLSSIYVINNLWASDGGCCGGDHSDKESGARSDQTMMEMKSEKYDVVKDPVCGMEVNEPKKSLSAEYKGNDYYFCSEHCQKTFKNDPVSYTPATAQQHDEDGGHEHGQEEHEDVGGGHHH